jgi:3-oxoadipate enol-lactonase
MIPATVSTEMAGQIPGARLEVIEGAGHLSNLEAPEAFNRLLLDHLAACGLP